LDEPRPHPEPRVTPAFRRRPLAPENLLRRRRDVHLSVADLDRFGRRCFGVGPSTREGHRLPPDRQLVAALADPYRVERLTPGRREVAPPVSASALGPLERTGDDEPRRRDLAAHVEPVLPGQIERSTAGNARCLQLPRDAFDLPLHHAQTTSVTDEAG